MRILSTSFFLLLILSCSSPKKILEKGDYKKAFKAALQQLKKDKQVSQNKEILAQSLDHIIRNEESKKIDFLDDGSLPALQNAFRINKKLCTFAADANPYLENAFEKQYQIWDTEKTELGYQIADLFFQEGQEKLDQALEEDNKFLAQKAYSNFIKAQDYGLSGSRLDSLISLSLKNAQVTINVVTNNIFDITQSWKIDRAFEDVQGYSSAFRKYYFDFIGANEKIDCQINLDFQPLSIQITETETYEDYNAEVVTGYNQVVDTSGHIIQTPITQQVQGRLIRKRINKRASWNLGINVYSNTRNCNMNSNSFIRQVSDEIEILSTQGDQRALPDTYKNIIQTREIKDDDEMAKELIQLLYNDFIGSYT